MKTSFLEITLILWKKRWKIY